MKLGVEPQSIGIKKMKTKWGSCNPTAQTIWLNLHLMKVSEELIEYVVLHEMTHLLERNHGPEFTSILEQHMPNWKQYRTDLNNLVFE